MDEENELFRIGDIIQDGTGYRYKVIADGASENVPYGANYQSVLFLERANRKPGPELIKVGEAHVGSYKFN